MIVARETATVRAFDPKARRGKFGRKTRLAIALLALGLPLLAGASASPGNKPVLDVNAPMASLPPAVIDDALAIGGDEIEARKRHTRMTAAVHVNGSGPYQFVVDSGADTSVIGANIAQALQLPAGKPAILHAMTESTQVERVIVESLGLGPTVVQDLHLPVLRERDLGAQGMIGIDALVRQRLMMDFDARVIKIEDADRPPPRLDGEIIVTARLKRGQLILTQATANRKPVEAVIDTGSEITIGNLALRDLLIRKNPDKFTKLVAIGVTGAAADLQIARVSELRLGSVMFRDVPMAFADVPPFAVFGLSKQPALLIGTDLMEKFRRISLDFRARKVRFQLRRCQSTDIALNSSYFSRLSATGPNPAVCSN